MKRPQLPVAISGPPESWPKPSGSSAVGAALPGAVALLERPREWAPQTGYPPTPELDIFFSPDTLALFDEWELDRVIREAAGSEDAVDAEPEAAPEPEPEPEPVAAEPEPKRAPTAATPAEASLTAPAVLPEPSVETVSAETATKEKGLLHYLGVSISAALLLLVVGLAALVIVAPAAVGGQALTVLTQSMEPGLPPGTLIVIRPQPVDEIRVGQVITYQIAPDEPAVVSHRVISKAVGSDGATTFITQGDNNDLPDENPVMEVQIRGTLWYSIPWLGYVNNAVNGEHRALVVPVAAGALFLYALVMVVGSARDRRRRRRTA